MKGFDVNFLPILGHFWIIDSPKKVPLSFEKLFIILDWASSDVYFSRKHIEVYSPGRMNQIPVFIGRIFDDFRPILNNRFPSKSFFKRLKSVFILALSFNRTYNSCRKLTLKKVHKNGQIFRSKIKEVNLNVSTILDHFWITDSPQKGSLVLEKAFFYLGLSFIGRIFLEKIVF